MDGIHWQRMYKDSLPQVDVIALLQPSGGQFLAMGEVAYCPSYCVSSTWYLMSSADGISWSVLGRLPAEPNLISTVYDTGGEFFAGGSKEPNGVVGPVGIWSSTNGADWTSLSDQDAFHEAQCAATRRGFINQFYDTRAGLVAAGTGQWFSNDGNHWQCEGDAAIGSVVQGGGVYVAPGSTGESTGLWSSSDGLNWQQSTTLSETVDVGSVASGFVAISDGNPMAKSQELFLTSADGKTWDAQKYPFGSRDVYGLASDGERAAVVEDPNSSSNPGAVWISSTDPTAWRQYHLPSGDGDQVDETVAVMGSTVVVTGEAGAGGPVIWTAQIP